MMLTVASGSFPIPPEVARRLPVVPDPVDGRGPDAARQAAALEHWLEASPEHAVDYDRMQRWRMIQEERAAEAVRAGQLFVVTADGLE